jgi:hypothetical protein
LFVKVKPPEFGSNNTLKFSLSQTLTIEREREREGERGRGRERQRERIQQKQNVQLTKPSNAVIDGI